MSYRRRASPLHATRAGVACGWCGALAVAALVRSNPLWLAALLVALLGAGAAAGVRRELMRALRFGLPLALAIALINALVTRNGLTVIWRFGQLPVLGAVNVTLEATVYGLLLGLRALALLLIAALYTAAVDPDQVLGLLRRLSFRSALTATIATRMVPVLARDARALADAQRCRPGRPPSRLALLRASTAGVLDRALEVAAALEVRGYGAARRPPRRHPSPWSRHDLAFAASALAVLALAIGAAAGGLEPLKAYPSLRVPAGAAQAAAAAALAVAVLAPFAGRRGIGGRA
jgi:energy-coupling factor transport system permease protein